jgi:hypothetical protein
MPLLPSRAPARTAVLALASMLLLLPVAVLSAPQSGRSQDTHPLTKPTRAAGTTTFPARIHGRGTRRCALSIPAPTLTLTSAHPNAILLTSGKAQRARTHQYPPTEGTFRPPRASISTEGRNTRSTRQVESA